MRPNGREVKIQDVNVTSACANTVSVTVDPASVTIHRGDTVNWIPLGSTMKIVVKPKKGRRIFPPRRAHWPFSDDRHVGQGKLASSGPARANAEADTYKYKIEVTCGSGKYETKITIDPEVIITD